MPQFISLADAVRYMVNQQQPPVDLAAASPLSTAFHTAVPPSDLSAVSQVQGVLTWGKASSIWGLDPVTGLTGPDDVG